MNTIDFKRQSSQRGTPGQSRATRLTRMTSNLRARPGATELSTLSSLHTPVAGKRVAPDQAAGFLVALAAGRNRQSNGSSYATAAAGQRDGMAFESRQEILPDALSLSEWDDDDFSVWKHWGGDRELQRLTKESLGLRDLGFRAQIPDPPTIARLGFSKRPFSPTDLKQEFHFLPEGIFEIYLLQKGPTSFANLAYSLQYHPVNIEAFLAKNAGILPFDPRNIEVLGIAQYDSSGLCVVFVDPEENGDENARYALPFSEYYRHDALIPALIELGKRGP